jgi:hypothetical protein
VLALRIALAVLGVLVVADVVLQTVLLAAAVLPSRHRIRVEPARRKTTPTPGGPAD